MSGDREYDEFYANHCQHHTPTGTRCAHCEAAKWKRLYENTVVQKEGMELYEEIKRLSNRVYELENIVKKGVWPK